MLKRINGGITAPKGYKAAGVKAGIKKSLKEDVALIFSVVPAAMAAVFTQNVMAAAPVQVSRQTAPNGFGQAIIVNSGCANACTGEQGLADAQVMAKLTAAELGIAPTAVLVASTGVIGVQLPMDKIAKGITEAVATLSETGHAKAAAAIMTTDTFTKVCGYEFVLGGVAVKIAGLAKGAGMIEPNMATTLGFVTTDAAVSPIVLKKALKDAIDLSFNMITVDGDCSTNDTVAVMANGQAGNPLIDKAEGADYDAFAIALKTVCIDLAKMVAQDGEGATKFLEIKVQGAATFEDAKMTAKAIANSPLVKTAFFGQDPNWGRIVCAAGYSGAKFDPAKISLALGHLTIVEKGLAASVDAKALEKVMGARDIEVTVDLGAGDEAATVWTCDFSYEYVKVNADYNT